MAVILPILLVCVGALVPQPDAPRDHARPTLLSETTSAAPGSTLWLAIDFEIDPGWHTYWAGQNDTGAPLKATFESSSNAEVGDLAWPAPHRYSPFEGCLDHVYEDRMTVLLPVEVASDAKPGDRVRVEASLNWLVCADVCLPESRELSIEVPVRAGVPAPDPRAAPAFRGARERTPPELKADNPVQIAFDEPLMTLRAIGAERVAFYAMEDARRPRRPYEECEARGDTMKIEFRDGEEPVAGILEAWSAGSGGSRLYVIRWPPAPQPDPAGEP